MHFKLLYHRDALFAKYFFLQALQCRFGDMGIA